MTPFVLDCSVTMAWCFEDQSSDYTEKVLDALARTSALVPSLWLYEVANVLLTAEKKGKITAADSVQFLELLSKLPILMSEEIPVGIQKELLSLGRNYQLSSYDTTYLLLAMQKGLPLATLDSDLIKSCQKAGVKIF